MNKILNEIHRIKNLMSLGEQLEIRDTTQGTVIIGDEFAELVSDSIQTIPSLVDEDMTINKLKKMLSSSEVFENVSNLILSIGTVDLFKDIKSINSLCDLIYEVFPNANLYVFKGVVSDFDFEDEKEIKAIEESSDLFYDEFEICGFEIIGNYSVITDVNVDLSNPAVLDLIEFANELNVVTNDLETEPEKVFSNEKGVNDSETDFDTIYEFLNQFGDIVRSKNIYDKNSGTDLKYDVTQIQISLNFLLGLDIEVNGVYDNETESAVRKYQRKKGLNTTGICDGETLEELFYDLKIKGFDENDLSAFIKKDFDFGEIIDGKVDFSNAGLSSEQQKNVEYMIDYMENNGITNPYAQIGILSVIGKECGFVPKNEQCYTNNDDSYIRGVFGSCRTNDEKLIKDWGVPLSVLKKDCYKFFEAMYGKKAKDCLGWKTGNDNPGDGYKYRGRGFNQITFKHNYKEYGNKLGQDLVSNPDLLNNVQIAAEAAVAFLTKGRSIPDFKNKKDATDYFVSVNAGGGIARSESAASAQEWMSKFDVK